MDDKQVNLHMTVKRASVLPVDGAILIMTSPLKYESVTGCQANLSASSEEVLFTSGHLRWL